MVRPKKFEYTTLGDVLSTETALIQSALALDQAAIFAVESRDVPALIAVSNGWSELAELLSGSGQNDEEEELPRPQQQMGFCLKPQEETNGESTGTDS